QTAGLRIISVHPNPAHDVLEIDGVQQGATVVVTNVLGSPVASATYDGTGAFRVSLHGLSVGLYVVRYTDAVGTVANTVIKQ
ncbi:MAG: T9SS type A sorting domain-containing protein, partial [Chitinophagaceae bacterium]|nr:T9SS type A sorting domain-containing protein [Chitinophagaceae bacterium]